MQYLERLKQHDFLIDCVAAVLPLCNQKQHAIILFWVSTMPDLKEIETVIGITIEQWQRIKEGEEIG